MNAHSYVEVKIVKQESIHTIYLLLNLCLFFVNIWVECLVECHNKRNIRDRIFIYINFTYTRMKMFFYESLQEPLNGNESNKKTENYRKQKPMTCKFLARIAVRFLVLYG